MTEVWLVIAGDYPDEITTLAVASSEDSAEALAATARVRFTRAREARSSVWTPYTVEVDGPYELDALDYLKD